MSTVSVPLDGEVAALLHGTNRPIDETVREFVVLELYRRGTISSGKAAVLLGMSLLEFIQHSSRLGIPFFDMTEDEWKAEQAVMAELWP